MNGNSPMADPTVTSTVTPAALQLLTSGGRGPLLLDVRTTGEFRTVHIPGARNIPLDVLRAHRDDLLDHLDAETVLVCHSGARAAQARELLADAGLSGLPVLDGGMVAWELADAPVERGPARWTLERQVRLVAGSVVLTTGLAGLVVPGLHLVGTAIGAGLTFAALTNTCALGMLLSRLPYNRGPRADLSTAVTALRAPR
ncbi:rhodanese-like domain-containing protein [Streptomyces yaizuensis]|nr:rhodanese-like domain-containing protein [Streptomyces sp. YSPA8]